MNIKDIAAKYRTDLIEVFEQIDLEGIQEISDLLFETYTKDRTVFILGNGGSASTASHMACDLGKGTLKNVYDLTEKRFRVISLTDNVATMTAFGNDLSYEDIFYQQLHNLIKAGDVVIGISASGNSPNIVKALEYAQSKGAKTVGFLGFMTGGKAKAFCDYSIVIQSKSYGVIEDLHLVLNHLLTLCLTKVKHQSDGVNQKKSLS